MSRLLDHRSTRASRKRLVSECSLTYSGAVTPRAPALSVEDRRASLVEVTIPLLREHGVGVTTKQVAEAAGIAEGTVFRAFGTKVPRLVGALTAIEKVHPKEEHYYLEVLGTHQDRQSKGIGSAVMSHMLDRCDTEGMPAYLESSNPRNIPFYARHGFEPTDEIVVGKGAPTVTAMWRDPR